MRCDNCGWNNPDNLDKCQKCNQDLIPPTVAAPVVPPVAAPVAAPVEPASLKATVLNNEALIDNKTEVLTSVVCPKCSYPFTSGTDTCPNCGAVVSSVQHAHEKVASAPATTSSSEYKNDMKKTVRDIEPYKEQEGQPQPMPDPQPENIQTVPTVRLTPMDNFDGKVENILLSDSETTLGREMVNNDPSVSENHAVISRRDGRYYIKNMSQSLTTYVSAAHEIELHEGDIVVIGNRRFIFN